MVCYAGVGLRAALALLLLGPCLDAVEELPSTPCVCSEPLLSLHASHLAPLRAWRRSPRGGDRLSADAQLACLAAQELLGGGFSQAVRVEHGRAFFSDCPQLLLPAAAACAEAVAAEAGAGEELEAEGRHMHRNQVSFWVRLAGAKLREAKVACVPEWVALGVPSLSASEVQWNVEIHGAAVAASVAGQHSSLDAFRWRRTSVPANLGDDSWPLLGAASSPLGALCAAAAAWAYDGAEVGDVCRGGDLGCAEGHCYAPLLDRALAAWEPALEQGSPRSSGARLLELGVCAGHSLATWLRYLDQRFGAAETQVLGVDRDLQAFNRHLPVLIAQGMDATRVRAVMANLEDIGAGGSLDASLSMVAPFDLIVDDASHDDDQVIAAFDRLFFDESLGLAPGGVYVVLDTQGSFRGNGSRLAHFKALADAAQWSGQTLVSIDQLDVFVALSLSREEAWVEAVEFHRGLVIVRKRRPSMRVQPVLDR
ncbi:unnamed protein product [Polarella glacialis]|uniref:Uncharacterized protein n=1 Tax=Polarella glacialis TaxID=89957 RepID=A0A813DIW9_POLGL|nr:unnamed protein product [Polarella glacialis]